MMKAMIQVYNLSKRRLYSQEWRRSGEGTGSPVALRHKDAGQESPDFANTEATSLRGCQK